MIPTSVPSHVLVPLERVGPVAFGDTREQIIERLGAPEQPFVNQAMNFEKLHYRHLGLSVIEFDTEDGCTWIATNPWLGEITLNGKILRGSVLGLVDWLMEEGFSVRRSDLGFTYCDELGLLFGQEDPEEDDVVTIAAVPRDYWKKETR